MTQKEWLDKGLQLFGENKKEWKFKCPICGNIQTYMDFEKIGYPEPENVVFYSCIGRWSKGKVGSLFDGNDIKKPCDYTNGGLFNMAKLTVIDDKGKEISVFEFAEND